MQFIWNKLLSRTSRWRCFQFSLDDLRRNWNIPTMWKLFLKWNPWNASVLFFSYCPLAAPSFCAAAATGGGCLPVARKRAAFQSGYIEKINPMKNLKNTNQSSCVLEPVHIQKICFFGKEVQKTFKTIFVLIFLSPFFFSPVFTKSFLIVHVRLCQK